MIKLIKEVRPFIAAIMLVTSVLISIEYIYHKKIDLYLSQFDLSFIGIVTNRTIDQGSFGMVSLKLIAATDNHDVRDSMSVYFCVIKDNKAEFISQNIRSYEVGDTVSVLFATRQIINITKKEVIPFNFPIFIGYLGFEQLYEL